MTPSEDLYRLIHSLSKTEKRFFKVFAPIGQGEKLYLKLFDLIASQKNYNEEAIMQKIGIRKSAFAFQKNYLHNLILHRMVFLGSSTVAQLRTLLTQAEFLYNRGLYAQEKKILRKAKHHAEQMGLNTYLLEILEMEYRLAWKNLDMQNVDKILKERQEIFLSLSNEHTYYLLENNMGTKFNNMGGTRRSADMNEIKKLMNDPILSNQNKAFTFYSRQSLYNIHQFYNLVSDNKKKACLFAKKRVDLYLSEPEKIKHKTVSYLIALYNLICLCSELKRHNEEKHYLDLLLKHSVLLTTKHEKTWAFFIFHDNNMNYYIKTGEFEAAMPIVEKLQRELQDYEGKLNELQNAMLYFKMAVIWFGMENYKKSIQMMNFIRNKEHMLHVRPDWESTIQIFYLVVHFEKKNIDLLSYLSKSSYRRMTGEKKIYKFETIMLDFFGKQTNKTNSQKNLTEQFKRLKKELLLLANNEYEKAPMQEFDFISWVDSKIENSPFAEIVKEKTNKSRKNAA